MTQPLLDFPTTYSLRAIGPLQDEFEQMVKDLVESYVPEPDRRSVSSRDSGGGNYRSVTVTFIAQSQEQLESIYSALGQQNQVLMLL
jgi:putative lipoic acid-binding regulatory protein